MSKPLWPHQVRALAEIGQARNKGFRRICLASPTGGGKSRVIAELMRQEIDNHGSTVVYTNRKMLVDQISTVLGEHGIGHGVRASGYCDDRDRAAQVSSIQTEHARFRAQKWDSLHKATLAIIDEAHLNKESQAQQIMQAHLNAGATVVGVTATPLGIGSLYDHLVVAGTTSELRRCGALVPCMHYGPDEPDTRHIKKIPLGEEISEKLVVKTMMVQGIFGRVLNWWNVLNPDHLPTILFAPGVKESIWFAEQFLEAGIAAAHIDGEDVWINGRMQKNSRELRDEILAASRSGEIKVLCNRFVLREGIDMPHLRCGIFATIFGSLKSYLQSGGRLLRAAPGKKDVTLIDHGGNWWRHGSLNADREWRLEWDERILGAMREDSFRKPPEEKDPPEPIRCPQCSMILAGSRCPCGWEARGGKKSRPVIQQDGSMIEMYGDIFQPRRICRKKNGPELWKKVYFASLKGEGRTFRAAAGCFAWKHKWQHPDPTWPLMPIDPLDWYRNVKDVPRERLRK